MPRPIGFKKPFIFSIVVASLLIFTFYVICNGIPFYHSDGYNKLPRQYDYPDSLIKKVIPNKKYIYWAFCSKLDSDTVIYSFGKKPKGLKLNPPFRISSLFVGCLPGICSKYILYVDSDKVHYVGNIEEFKSFLGSIDNLQEAVLFAKAKYHLQIDDDMRGGSYMIQADTIYNLRLMHYIPCPETKQSFYLKIKRNKGVTDTSTLVSYYKSDNCIVY